MDVFFFLSYFNYYPTVVNTFSHTFLLYLLLTLPILYTHLRKYLLYKEAAHLLPPHQNIIRNRNALHPLLRPKKYLDIK